MARLVFGMNQSLDGYVDHTRFAPSPTLFRHFVEDADAVRGKVNLDDTVVDGAGQGVFAIDERHADERL